MLKDTGALIDPQMVSRKSFYGVNAENLDLSRADFSGVEVRFAKLANTGARLSKFQQEVLRGFLDEDFSMVVCTIKDGVSKVLRKQQGNYR